MAKGKAIYKSYLLRVWRDEGNGRCRIRLELVDKEPLVLHFADLDSFLAYMLSTIPHDAEFESRDPPY
jgi:hypothetical protein